MRIGVCWSGRKDNWVNRYKSFPVQHIIDLAQKFPQHDWINLQAEMTDDETSAVHQSNIVSFPGAISHWADTAGLVHHLDLVVSMDTSVAHLAASMGKPTWIPLTKFAVDWRWGTVDDTTPWYPTARLFRQSDFGDWHSVFQQLAKYIDLFKI
jgi:hypothetical protein